MHWKKRVYGLRDGDQMSKGWKAISQRIKRRDKCCVLCEERSRLTVHHIVPRDMGGSNAEMNLVTLCISCHNEIELACLHNYEIFWEYIKRNKTDAVNASKKPMATDNDWKKWVYGGYKRGNY